MKKIRGFLFLLLAFSSPYAYGADATPQPPNMGHHNNAQSCFINSTAQLFFHTQPFRQFFNFARSNGVYMAGSAPTRLINVVREMAKNNQRLHLSKPGHGTIGCDFRATVAAPLGMGGSGQHDASEFLNRLLEQLHESAQGAKKAEAQRRLRDHYKVSLYTVTKCTYNHPTETEEASNMISLALENNNTREALTSVMLKNKRSPTDADWRCFTTDCNFRGVGERTITFSSAPNVLIVHLQRTNFNPAENRYFRINKPVSFPLEGLNIKPYLTFPTDDITYNLVGFILHAGSSMEAGHYYSFFKWGADWFYYNDLENIGQKDRTTEEQVAIILSDATKDDATKITTIKGVLKTTTNALWQMIADVINNPEELLRQGGDALKIIRQNLANLKEVKERNNGHVPNAAREATTLNLPRKQAAHIPTAVIQKIADQNTPAGKTLADKAHLEGYPYILVYQRADWAPDADYGDRKDDDSEEPPAQTIPWQCPECTYQNKALDVVCSICGTSKPAQAPISAPAATAPSWQCDACTFQNEATADKCTMCDTPKPAPAPTGIGGDSAGPLDGTISRLTNLRDKVAVLRDRLNSVKAKLEELHGKVDSMGPPE